MSMRQIGTVLQHLRRSFRVNDDAMPSDAQLLEQWRTQHDEIAFELLLRRHGPMVFGLCSRLLNQSQDAEDAFQATFLVLVRKADSINKRKSLGSWLYKVAYRVALRIRNRPAPLTTLLDPESIEQNQTMQEDMVWKDLRPIIDDEVLRLPHYYREAFVLCCLQGKTNEEAARELGCPLGTVLSRLSRARAHLRNRLSRRGVELSAAVITASLSQSTLAAALPAKLIGCTIGNVALDAGLSVLANQAVPETIASLTQGVIKTMYITKIKIAATILLIAGFVGTGGGLLTQHIAFGQAPVEEQYSETNTPVLMQSMQWKEVAGWKCADGDCESLVFSPNGKWLATGNKKGIIHFWSPDTGDLTKSVNSHTKLIDTLAFSPDGKLLASGSKKGVITLLDVQSGELLARIDQNKSVETLAFTPDGKYVASGDGKVIQVWDVPTGKRLIVLDRLLSADSPLLFLENAKKLNLGDEIRLWDKTALKYYWRDYQTVNKFDLLTLAPDGRIVAVSEGQGFITLIDAATGKKLRKWQAHTGTLLSLKFSPDGEKLASGGKDYSIRLWDVKTGKQLHQGVHDAPVKAIAFSPDGKLIVSTGEDKKVKVWRQTVIKKVRFVSVANPAVPKRLLNLVKDLAQRKKSNQDCIEALFLATLGRFPTSTEVQLLGTQLKMTKNNRQQKLQELMTTLTRSNEFRSHVQELQSNNPEQIYWYYAPRKSGK